MAESDGSLEHYVIRGGEAGKQRLDLLAEIMDPSTKTLLANVGVGHEATFVDLGGGGHVSLEAARLVGPAGSVPGVDLDKTKVGSGTEGRRRIGADERPLLARQRERGGRDRNVRLRLRALPVDASERPGRRGRHRRKRRLLRSGEPAFPPFDRSSIAKWSA